MPLDLLNLPPCVAARRWAIALGSVSVLLALCSPARGEPVVRKMAETFDSAAWPIDGWNRAVGTTSLDADVSPDAAPGKCLKVEVRFSGKGFEWFGASAAEPLAVPGDIQSVSLRYKLSDKRYPLIVKFTDGWGRSEVDEKKLEWALPGEAEGQWATATFRVPAGWVRPVSIVGMATHNWSQESQARTVHFWLDQIEVQTDLAGADPQTGVLQGWKPDPQPKDPKTARTRPPTTPLVAVALSTGQPNNVFAGQEPGVALSVRSWKPGTLQGTLTVDVRDEAGRPCDHLQRPIAVDSVFSLDVPVKAPRFGLYTLQSEVALTDGTKHSGRITFAKLSPSRELTPDEMRASPYGINVNGGKENLAVESFRRAGIVWFRDYAFGYDWLLRAKGDDHRYAGWPWYPKILQRYRQAGALVLPCLMRSIRPPVIGKDGTATRLGPDRAWVREIADAINTFPDLTCWELDNEYDLSKEHADAEAAVQWRNYRMFHRKLGEIVALLGGGEVTAVEQGAAGIYPERIRQSVQSGDFNRIGVVNSHYYCGSEAPELNVGNWNMDAAGDFRRQPPMFLADRLREAKRAAQCDGRPRESWLTEFGWDTLAGPSVSPRQQAAYLARGWLLALAAGTDKCFWFYDFDAAEPKQFFDGCGLLTADGSPKLSLCAMAGLASVLPCPKYVGSLDAGEGTCGYVFANGPDLVAALWSIQDDAGPTVTFQAKELRDYLGNRLDGLSTRLSLEPVYAVGLSKDDPFYRQTAYELTTPRLAAVTAGDTVAAVVEVRNLRAEPIRCAVRLTPPEGWAGEKSTVAASVAPGEKQSVTLSLVVPPNEPMGRKKAMLLIAEQQVVKRIPLEILVQPALLLDVGPLPGTPGPATLAVKVGNRSTKPMDGVLRLRLPKSWTSDTPAIAVKDLKPEETREIACRLAWDTHWQPGESASVTFDAGGGRSIAGSIVPGRYRIPRAHRLTIDGRDDDWPADSQLPDWVLRASPGQAPARIRLAWSPDGLYGFVEVPEAALDRPDPRSFWTCNCLELFVDCRDDKRDRTYAPGDHQIWLVPLVADKRVYAGQWKRGAETPETRYDLKSVEGVALAKGRGYAMEFHVPAAELAHYAPAAGKSIGLNVNLSIKSKLGNREVYWPSAKNSGVLNRPGAWGSMELVE